MVGLAIYEVGYSRLQTVIPEPGFVHPFPGFESASIIPMSPTEFVPYVLNSRDGFNSERSKIPEALTASYSMRS
jgi:hypothetical protein